VTPIRPPLHCLDDGVRVDALVDVEESSGHLEGGVLSLLPAHTS
jgi:hypothetical protein